MKPKTKVLLLLTDENELGLWRFRLEVGGRYRVLGATDPMTALELVAEYPDCRIAATTSEDSVAILRMALQLDSVLLFGMKKAPDRSLAHRVVVNDGTGCVDLVRNAVREMAARRRGPVSRALKFEESPTIATLLEERDVGITVAA